MSETNNDSIDRHPALQDLSRDHHNVLVLCLEIKRSLDDQDHSDEDLDVRSPQKMAEQLITFWQTEGNLHFREEEEAFLPVYMRHVSLSDNEDLRQMLHDHAWLRDRVERLEQLLQTDEPFHDLLSETGERLKQHARLEERAVFEHAQEVLSDEELNEVGRRSRAFRTRNNMNVGAG